MRAISDYTLKEFASLGIPPVVDHQLLDGQQWIKFSGGTKINVGAFASDAEIMAAARKAFNMTDDNIETAPDDAKPTADKMPAVDLAPVAQALTSAPAPTGSPPAKRAQGAQATAGDHASSIQDMMQKHVQAMSDIRDASIQTLRLSLERQLQALSAAPKKVAEKIDGQTDDFLAIMGQFTNDLGI